MNYYHQDDPDTLVSWEQLVDLAGSEDEEVVNTYIRENGYIGVAEGDSPTPVETAIADTAAEEITDVKEGGGDTYNELEKILNTKPQPPGGQGAHNVLTTDKPVVVDPDINITTVNLPNVFEDVLGDFFDTQEIDREERNKYNIFDIVEKMQTEGTFIEKNAANYLSDILNLKNVDPENPFSILSQEPEAIEKFLETNFGGIEVVKSGEGIDELKIFVKGKDSPYVLNLHTNSYEDWVKNLK